MIIIVIVLFKGFVLMHFNYISITNLQKVFFELHSTEQQHSSSLLLSDVKCVTNSTQCRIRVRLEQWNGPRPLSRVVCFNSKHHELQLTRIWTWKLMIITGQMLIAFSWIRYLDEEVTFIFSNSQRYFSPHEYLAYTIQLIVTSVKYTVSD